MTVQNFTNALGTATFDPSATPNWSFSPSTGFTSHLQGGAQFKNADGTFKTSAEIGALLAAPSAAVPNPVAQPKIPKPIAISDLVNAAPTTLASLAVSDLEPIAARVREGDREGIQKWADVLNLKSIMSASEHTAVTTLVNDTIGDPNWAATVPGPSDLETTFGVGCVDHRMITAVTKVA